MNVNAGSTLKLGQARGVVMLAPARAGLPVFEYSANLVKKSVTGAGHADKRQIAMMVGRLLPGVEATGGCRRRARGRDLPCPSSRHRQAHGGGALIAKLKGVVDSVDEGSAVDRRERRRLSGLGLVAHLARPRGRRRGDPAGRDHRARGCDRALRLPRDRRARLVPHPDDGAGRRRPGRAVDPVDPVARRDRPRHRGPGQRQPQPAGRRRPKLAARLATELKDKAAAFGVAPARHGRRRRRRRRPGSINEDAVSALVNLGYRRVEAFGAVARVTQRLGAGASSTP